MSADTYLDQAADVLEKMAEYLETQESQKIATVKREKTKTAKVLADKIAEAVGEHLDDTMVEKLSELSPDMQDLLGRVTGAEVVDSLGGPEESMKIASIVGNMSSADARFLSWIQS